MSKPKCDFKKLIPKRGLKKCSSDAKFIMEARGQRFYACKKHTSEGKKIEEL